MHSLNLLSCFRYHKGTDFQANHNTLLLLTPMVFVVLDTTKVQIFKQITTRLAKILQELSLFQIPQRYRFSSKSQLPVRDVFPAFGCFRYHKGTDFQANHNSTDLVCLLMKLFQIPQRYRFSSKSQRFLIGMTAIYRCFRYHKGTDFQANHNTLLLVHTVMQLFQIPQRYRFSSKSQRISNSSFVIISCFRYHKGTDFQANHNTLLLVHTVMYVVLDTTKVQIFKQITTL